MLLTPHPDYERLRRALTRSPRLARPFSGTAYRSTSPAYAGSKDLVSGEGVRRHGARWNPPGLAAVYASLLPETAVAEALAQFRRAGIPEFAAMPRVLVALEVSLARVLPLTSGSVRRRLRVSGRRLVNEKWWEMQERGREALTQALGRAAYEAGLEGLLAPSATGPRKANVVVFPETLGHESRLRVFDEPAAR